MTAALDPTSNGHHEVALDPVVRLAASVRGQAEHLDRQAIRQIVAARYGIQDHRISFANQARALEDAGHPTDLPDHFRRYTQALEDQLEGVLGHWAAQSEAGRWMLCQFGVGPVIAAGLLAHIDFTRAQTAGALWRYSGYDPSATWGKGERRPHNADLKTLVWKLGDSFVKFSNHPRCWYGHLYRDKKAQLAARNRAGAFAQLATQTLETRTFRNTAEAQHTKATYQTGRLPDGRIDLQARRWVEKLFLAHLHEVGRAELGLPCPEPYVIEHLGHAHKITRPNGCKETAA